MRCCKNTGGLIVAQVMMEVAVVGSTSAANKVRIFAFLLGVREWGGP